MLQVECNELWPTAISLASVLGIDSKVPARTIQYHTNSCKQHSVRVGFVEGSLPQGGYFL